MMKFMGEPVTQEEIDVSHLDNLSPVKLRLTLFQDILDEADKDQNGLIDYKEFFDMMEPGRSQHFFFTNCYIVFLCFYVNKFQFLCFRELFLKKQKKPAVTSVMTEPVGRLQSDYTPSIENDKNLLQK